MVSYLRAASIQGAMAGAGKTVYVYSVIPRLSKLIQDQLTDVRVIEIKCKGMISVLVMIVSGLLVPSITERWLLHQHYLTLIFSVLASLLI